MNDTTKFIFLTQKLSTETPKYKFIKLFLLYDRKWEIISKMDGLDENHSLKVNERRVSVFDHEQSLMFGRYRDQLSQFAREISDKNQFKKSGFIQLNQSNIFYRFCNSKVFKYCGDWFVLICLGVCISLLSFVIDLSTHYLFDCKYDIIIDE